MSGNEHLLDDLFIEDERESDVSSESSSSDDLVDWAERLIASAQSDTSVANKWLTNEKGLSIFYDSNRKKLILLKNNLYFDYEGNGEFQFTGARPIDGGDVSESITDESFESLPIVWITSIPRSFLTLDESEHLSSFFQKFNFEDSFVRHILKLDKLLVSYIIDRFDPQKAKPRNAFINYCDSLNSKFPQPWRRKSFLAIPENGECETKELRGVLNFGKDDDLGVEIEHAGFSGGQFFFLGSDPYVGIERDSDEVKVLVDGVRCLARDGPIGPLRDGSVVSISSSTATEYVPDHLFLIEIAQSQSELIDRRKIGTNLD